MLFWTEHRTAPLTFRQLLSLRDLFGCSTRLLNNAQHRIHELPFLKIQYRTVRD